MAWHPFNVDHEAHMLVLEARERDRNSLNQAYKMRASCAYGLERFWGEHLRLRGKEPTKADFVKETWKAFCKIMKESRPDFIIPQEVLSNREKEVDIRAEAEKFLRLSTADQQECLTVLVALCDAIVWWTQRLKLKSKPPHADANDIAAASENNPEST